ncbi:MAG: hypothetical protein ACLUUF_02500 [Bifidobacterium pullorum]
MGANHSLLSGGTTVKRRIAAIAAGIATAAMALGGVVAPPATAYADEFAAADVSSVTNPDGRHFMVYYRAWRDVTMKGVNTDLPDEN